MAAGKIMLTMLLVVLTIMTATINNKTTIANMLMRMRKTIIMRTMLRILQNVMLMMVTLGYYSANMKR